MIKALWRFLSDVCYKVGAHSLSLKFLAMSLEDLDVTAPIIHMSNDPLVSAILNRSIDANVVWEDKESIRELGSLRTNDLFIPKSIYDIN